MTANIFIEDFKLMWPLIVPGAILAACMPKWYLSLCVCVLTAGICCGVYLK